MDDYIKIEKIGEGRFSFEKCIQQDFMMPGLKSVLWVNIIQVFTSYFIVRNYVINRPSVSTSEIEL